MGIYLTAVCIPDANEYIDINCAFYRLHFILPAFPCRHLRLCSCQNGEDAGATVVLLVLLREKMRFHPGHP